MLVATFKRPTRTRDRAAHDCSADCGCQARPDDLKAYTGDAERTRYYSTEHIGDNQSVTPEGFLICRNVPIARTGPQLYADYEMPKIEAVGGIVRMDREEAEVFRPQTIASFEGKPVTIDHPTEDVTPDNWKTLAVGVVQNVRRGTGIEDNLLLADLLITDRQAIEAVHDGLREVSCGYDNSPEQIAPGRGRQTNIIGNHVALVDKGRCGARCAIQDNKGVFMSNNKVIDRIKAAFASRDEKAFDAALKDAEKEPGEGGMNIHVHTSGDKSKDEGETSYEERLKKANDEIAELKAKDKARDEKEEEEKKAKDKAKDEAEEKEKKEKEEKEAADKAKDSLVDFSGSDSKTEEQRTRDAADQYREIAARAEILKPGITLPKIKDGAVKDGKVNDALCIVKRHALSESLTTDAGKKAITPFLEGRTIDRLPCGVVDAAFLGASEIIKAANNSKATTRVGDSSQTTADAFAKGGLDKIHHNFWHKEAKK